MTVIVNGEVDRTTYQDAFDPPDRAIKLHNITIGLSRTPDGGWKEKTTDCTPPDGGSMSGHTLANLAKHNPWVAEQLWRRIVELEDERRILRQAINYRE